MNKNQEIAVRIQTMIDFIGISKYEFSKKLNYSRPQSVYNILEGKSNPSYDFFYKLKESEYSSLFNTDWIITGEGDMLKSNYKEADLGMDSVKDIESDYESLKGELIIEDQEELLKLALKCVSNMDRMISDFKFFDNAFELEVYKRLLKKSKS